MIHIHDFHLRFLLHAVSQGEMIPAAAWRWRLFIRDLSELVPARWPHWLCATDGHRWHAVNIDASYLLRGEYDGPDTPTTKTITVEHAQAVLKARRRSKFPVELDLEVDADPSYVPYKGCHQVVPHVSRRECELQLTDYLIHTLGGEGETTKRLGAGHRRAMALRVAPLGIGLYQPDYGTAWFPEDSFGMRQGLRGGKMHRDLSKQKTCYVDLRYMTEAAEQSPSDSAQTLLVRMADELDPVVVRPAENRYPASFAVIMPMRGDG